MRLGFLQPSGSVPSMKAFEVVDSNLTTKGHESQTILRMADSKERMIRYFQEHIAAKVAANHQDSSGATPLNMKTNSNSD